jgi:hypothetical protein
VIQLLICEYGQEYDNWITWRIVLKVKWTIQLKLSAASYPPDLIVHLPFTRSYYSSGESCCNMKRKHEITLHELDPLFTIRETLNFIRNGVCSSSVKPSVNIFFSKVYVVPYSVTTPYVCHTHCILAYSLHSVSWQTVSARRVAWYQQPGNWSSSMCVVVQFLCSIVMRNRFSKLQPIQGGSVLKFHISKVPTYCLWCPIQVWKLEIWSNATVHYDGRCDRTYPAELNCLPTQHS